MSTRQTFQPRIFDIKEANGLIPQLEKLLVAFEKKYETFKRLQDELFFEELLEGSSPPEIRFQELEKALVQMEEEVEKIQRFGCLLRHLQQGLVDFLAQKEGEKIYYCWRRGEKEIGYYHTLRGGFFERRPLH